MSTLPLNRLGRARAALPGSPAQQRLVELFDVLAPNPGITPLEPGGCQSDARQSADAAYAGDVRAEHRDRLPGSQARFSRRSGVPVRRAAVLVLSVPLPFECETEASPEEPFLGISVRVDLTMVAELLMALNETQGTDAERTARHLFDAARSGVEQCRAAIDGSVGLAARRAHSRAWRGARNLLSRVDGRAGRRDSRGAHASESFRPHRQSAEAHSRRLSRANSMSIRSPLKRV